MDSSISVNMVTSSSTQDKSQECWVPSSGMLIFILAWIRSEAREGTSNYSSNSMEIGLIPVRSGAADRGKGLIQRMILTMVEEASIKRMRPHACEANNVLHLVYVANQLQTRICNGIDYVVETRVAKYNVTILFMREIISSNRCETYTLVIARILDCS
ncbi:hypothetical protein IEQ34_004839 [Dendrobium chrysotoxum]|uniref:Uncharacterized protein n=1 Tax=Dendrobium chrysotoxum TaxID=161865 RepID=A0AAV7H809_DENCH|nr:hypothetical protein IEQ34_004839 [Dendrobium chrysotoxum]